MGRIDLHIFETLEKLKVKRVYIHPENKRRKRRKWLEVQKNINFNLNYARMYKR